MPFFSFSKADKYKNEKAKSEEDIIDIKFLSELKENPLTDDKELLIFVVDDDPNFLQILNTHFSKLKLATESGTEYKFRIRNYATGRSCLNELDKYPDLIFLNYFINDGIPNALKGSEVLDEIVKANPNQKVIILNDLDDNLRGAFVENGLRDYIIQDNDALTELNRILIDILN